jgi:(4-alkanoyl-5-oxo-2,5-dihydrofuran-3-yl)methyl phosphate reductase
MILVTGATGNVGAPLVRELVAAGQHVRAFVTDTGDAKQKLGDKVELAKGTFEDKASIEAALRGVKKVYLLAPGMPDLTAWEATFVDAAKHAGVEHVVYHSVAGAQWEANAFGRWHRATEKKLEQSGMTWTFLRPVGFFSNALMWAATVKSQGAIYMPCGDGKTASIDARDIAAVAAKALAARGHEGKSYDLTGPEALSVGEQAKQLGDAIGKPVTYVDVPDAAAKDSMLGMGMAAAVADAMIELTSLVRSGGAASISDAVATVTGKPPRSFAAWCKDNAAAFR